MRNSGPRHGLRHCGARRGRPLTTRSRRGGYRDGRYDVGQKKADVRAGSFRGGVGEAHEREDKDRMEDQRRKDGATDRIVRNPAESGSPVQGRIATRVLGPPPG
jgi:hypothetical protein